MGLPGGKRVCQLRVEPPAPEAGFSDSGYLHFLLVLEPPLANDHVLDSPPVSKLLLKHGVILEELLRLVFGDSVQRVLVDHTDTFKLEKKRFLIRNSSRKEGQKNKLWCH